MAAQQCTHCGTEARYHLLADEYQHQQYSQSRKSLLNEFADEDQEEWKYARLQRGDNDCDDEPTVSYHEEDEGEEDPRRVWYSRQLSNLYMENGQLRKALGEEKALNEKLLNENALLEAELVDLRRKVGKHKASESPEKPYGILKTLKRVCFGSDTVLGGGK